MATRFHASGVSIRRYFPANDPAYAKTTEEMKRLLRVAQKAPVSGSDNK